MTSRNAGLIAAEGPDPEIRRMCAFGIVCAILIGAVTWAVDSDSPQESLNPNPANSYYNLLVQGFQAGQLNMKMQTPPEFAMLADPYNPAHRWDTSLWADKLDLSYYNGKFYIYYGVTPVIVFFWPYAAITGHYLSDRDAVAVVFPIGFLLMGWLLWDMSRRYFPEISIGAFFPAIFILGLILSLTLGGSIYAVARAFGFTFVMAALAGVWLALHRPARRARWLLVASLAYGLAVGSRPSLLFGAIILLIPVIQTWHEASETVSARRVPLHLVSAIVPIALVGIGLMVYNDLRFDSPFEFGRHYSLTADFNPKTARQFSLHYFWFNVRYYFLEPVKLSIHFPFLQDVPLPPLPSGKPAGGSSTSGGILVNYPFLIFVFVLPSTLKNRTVREISILRSFMLALFLLFAATVLPICLIVRAWTAYILDFLPPMMLLAFIGFFELERARSASPGRRCALRVGFYALLGYSLVFNSLVNIKARAFSNYCAAARLLAQNRPEDALQYLKNAVLLEPHISLYHNHLALVYAYAGSTLIDQHRPDDAVDYLKDAVSLDPRTAIYHDQLALAYAYSTKHQTDQALRELKTALRIDPNCTKADYDLGSLLYQNGRSDEAYKYLRQALAADSAQTNFNYAAANIVVASLLISNPDPHRRDGPLAIRFAEAACQETGYKDAYTLGVSAAVFGENGRTNEALSLAQKAVVEAKQNGESNILQAAQSLLNVYLKRRPVAPFQDKTNGSHAKESLPISN